MTDIAAEKVFFFDFYGDARKVLCQEEDVESVQDLVSLLKKKYEDVEINTEDVRFWTKDETYGVRHKIESPQDIYNGAVIEITSGSNHKRERQENEICSTMKKTRYNGPRFILRLRGLPWHTTQSQIKEFFEGIELVRIQFLYQSDGRASGDGLVEFKNEQDMEKGLLKDKENIGKRYIDITKTTVQDMDRALGLVDIDAIKDINNKVLRMRGLPYSATEGDVLDFFKAGDLIPERVHLICDRVSGRATGIALVEFENEKDIVAALALNRNEIGDRYIELFRGSMGELKDSLGVSSKSRGGMNHGAFNGGMGGTGAAVCGDAFIKMRGLPFNTNEKDIVDFFQEVEVSPVRIHLKADGSEAIAEFRSADVSKAMSRQKCYLGHRYVDLIVVGFDEVANIVGFGGRMPLRPFF